MTAKTGVFFYLRPTEYIPCHKTVIKSSRLQKDKKMKREKAPSVCTVNSNHHRRRSSCATVWCTRPRQSRRVILLLSALSITQINLRALPSDNVCVSLVLALRAHRKLGTSERDVEVEHEVNSENYIRRSIPYLDKYISIRDFLNLSTS